MKLLGKLSVPERPTFLKNWKIVGQGPIARTVSVWGCLDIFSLVSLICFISPFWDTARYRLKCCIKRPLKPKQATNQPCSCQIISEMLPDICTKKSYFLKPINYSQII